MSKMIDWLGPSTFSGATGSPSLEHRGTAVVRACVQLEEIAWLQKKNR